MKIVVGYTYLVVVFDRLPTVEVVVILTRFPLRRAVDLILTLTLRMITLVLTLVPCTKKKC